VETGRNRARVNEIFSPRRVDSETGTAPEAKLGCQSGQFWGRSGRVRGEVL